VEDITPDQLVGDTLETLSTGAEDTTEAFDTLSDVSEQLGNAFGETVGPIGSFVGALSRLTGGGGGGFLGIASTIFGLLGSFGGGGASGAGAAGGAWAGGARAFAPLAPIPRFAAGGLVKAGYASSMLPIPKDFLNKAQVPQFAAGGTVKGPTLGLLGEGQEDEYVIPKSQMAKLRQKDNGQQPTPTVIINGNIAPNPPGLNESDVIQIVYKDAYNGGKTSKAMTNIIKRTR